MYIETGYTQFRHMRNALNRIKALGLDCYNDDRTIVIERPGAHTAASIVKAANIKQNKKGTDHD